MRAVLLLAIFAVAVPDRPAPPVPEAPPIPQIQVLGDWRDRATERQVLRIGPSASEFLVNGIPSVQDGLTGAYAIDWSKNPVAIDFMPRRGGAKLECILKLDGDRLSLALPLNNEPRPTAFNSAKCVLHYQRVK